MEDNSTLFEGALEKIDRGREGLNEGIPIPFERLSYHIPNIQQGVYTLIGAASGIGKTSWADDVFLYNTFNYITDNPDCGIELDIDYFSFEIDKQMKIIKGVSRQIWHDYGIIADVDTILSKGKKTCSDELYKLVIGYKDKFDQLEDYLTISDEVDNCTGINKYLIDKAKKHGTIVRKNINKDPDGDPIMRFDKYIPNNPKRYWIIIIDHISLLLEEKRFPSLKQNIDKMSSMLVSIRNNFNAIPVVIQQLAFDSENDDRHKAGRLSPTLRDFGDSKYTVRDSDIALALFSPYRYNLERYMGYDITKLRDGFRGLEILKNRYGEPNINIGLNFIGAAGTFREIPKSSEITASQYEYAASLANARSKYVKQGNLWVPRN